MQKNDCESSTEFIKFILKFENLLYLSSKILLSLSDTKQIAASKELKNSLYEVKICRLRIKWDYRDNYDSSHCITIFAMDNKSNSMLFPAFR